MNVCSVFHSLFYFKITITNKSSIDEAKPNKTTCLLKFGKRLLKMFWFYLCNTWISSFPWIYRWHPSISCKFYIAITCQCILSITQLVIFRMLQIPFNHGNCETFKGEHYWSHCKQWYGPQQCRQSTKSHFKAKAESSQISFCPVWRILKSCTEYDMRCANFGGFVDWNQWFVQARVFSISV